MSLLALLDPAVPLPPPDGLLDPSVQPADAGAALQRALALFLADLAAWSGRPPPPRLPQTAVGGTEPQDRPAFAQALRSLMHAHGDTTGRLHAALTKAQPGFSRPVLCAWLRGCDLPVHVRNFGRLHVIEDRYGLEPGFFRDRTTLGARTVRRHALPGLSAREQAIVAWHIPDDFETRSACDQAAVLAWVRSNILPGATPFRAWQTPVSREAYALEFKLPAASPTARPGAAGAKPPARKGSHTQPRRPPAPVSLDAEVAALVAFKTAALTPLDLHRRRTWRIATAQMQVSRLAALFGALVRAPDAPSPGLGLQPDDCSLALLIMPQIWDWFLAWRYARRGSYSTSEDGLIRLACALSGRQFGWLRQNPQLKDRLVPVAPLFGLSDVRAVRADWDGACDRLERFGATRLRDISRLSRKHRDPFEAIAPVLASPSPLRSYRRIATEAARYLPDGLRSPKERAEALRFILIFRLALHLGFRQRSLRELTFRPGGRPAQSAPDNGPTPDDAAHGELAWCDQTRSWTVSAPPGAFKNSGSSFFCGQPYFQSLPDLDGLNLLIEEYLTRSRPLLLGTAAPSPVLFVKSMQRGSARCSLSPNAFYKIWYDGVRRFGVYNPFTRRGAVEGLLPHGPHNVRDVIATHVLKTTGSFLTASYAIQDTPRTVEKHYGRFLPVDKVGLAADVLNRAWVD